MPILLPITLTTYPEGAREPVAEVDIGTYSAQSNEEEFASQTLRHRVTCCKSRGAFGHVFV